VPVILYGHCRRFGERTIKEIGFQTVPKTASDGADVTFCGGRLFHSLEAATGKARSPMVELTIVKLTTKANVARKVYTFSSPFKSSKYVTIDGVVIIIPVINKSSFSQVCPMCVKTSFAVSAPNFFLILFRVSE